MRSRSRLVAIILLASVLVACGQPTTAPPGPELAPAPNVAELDLGTNDLETGQKTFEHSLDNGRLELSTIYSSTHNTKQWRITAPKNLILEAKLTTNKEQAVVLVEHVHIDVFLVSALASIDGKRQDVADLKLSTGPQAGPAITQYGYINYMSIEGSNETLKEIWKDYTEHYSLSQWHERGLTENNLLRECKVKGNLVQVVWNILIRYPGDEEFHIATFMDKFSIPVDKELFQRLNQPTPVPNTPTPKPS